MSTTFPNAREIARKWHVIDATDQTLGRLSSRVASILAGKENPMYTPFIDTGDHVVILNCAKIRLTGLKSEQKLYWHYTGYPGGIRKEEFKKRFERQPQAVVEDAIRGMLPHNKLGRAMFKKLKAYRDDKHPHQAQGPQELVIPTRKRA